MYDIKNYNGSGFRCSCGRFHKPVLENIICVKGGMEKLADYVKNFYAAGHLAFLTFSDIPKTVADSAEKNLRKNFKVSKIVFPPNTKCSTEAAREILNLGDDVRFIVGLGSGRLNDIIKLAVNMKNGLNYLYYPTAPSSFGYALSHFIFVEDGKLKTQKSPNCKCLVLDEEVYSSAPKNLIAAGYGEIFSRYLLLFDNYFETRLSKSNHCSAITGEIKNALDNFFENKNYAKISPKEIMETLVGISIKESLLYEDLAFKSTEVLSQLISLSSSGNIANGLDNLIASLSLIAFYKSYFSGNSNDIFIPQDGLKKIKYLKGMCGFNYEFCLEKLFMQKNSDYMQNSYVLNEYKSEFRNFIETQIPDIKNIAKTFRRFYSDCGYFIGAYISQKEIMELMSASGIFMKGLPLIKHLNIGGFTDAALCV